MNPEGEKQSFINPESHKIIYQNEYDRMTEEYDAEYFAWAEDLYNSRIIVYSDKGKNLKNTDSIHSCGIIVEDLHSVSCVKCVMALVDTDTGDIYISDTSFNINWKMIRRSIEYGMELYVQDGGELNIETAKELVDVSRLDKKGYKASIVHGRIKLIKDDSDEKKEDENNPCERLKKNLLADPNLNYFYSILSIYVHDRQCDEVKDIEADVFSASKVIPDGMVMCLKCKRNILLRQACSGNEKQMSMAMSIFRRYNINIDLLERAILKSDMKIVAYTPFEMAILCSGDRWIVKMNSNKKPEIWFRKEGQTEKEQKNAVEVLDVDEKHVTLNGIIECIGEKYRNIGK